MKDNKDTIQAEEIVITGTSEGLPVSSTIDVGFEEEQGGEDISTLWAETLTPRNIKEQAPPQPLPIKKTSIPNTFKEGKTLIETTPMIESAMKTTLVKFPMANGWLTSSVLSNCLEGFKLAVSKKLSNDSYAVGKRGKNISGKFYVGRPNFDAPLAKQKYARVEMTMTELLGETHPRETHLRPERYENMERLLFLLNNSYLADPDNPEAFYPIIRIAMFSKEKYKTTKFALELHPIFFNTSKGFATLRQDTKYQLSEAGKMKYLPATTKGDKSEKQKEKTPQTLGYTTSADSKLTGYITGTLNNKVQKHRITYEDLSVITGREKEYAKNAKRFRERVERLLQKQVAMNTILPEWTQYSVKDKNDMMRLEGVEIRLAYTSTQTSKKKGKQDE